MNPAYRVILTLVLAAGTWPAGAATDYFWNCTQPNGIKYADATRCDKGDTSAKMMKGQSGFAAGQAQMVQMVRGVQMDQQLEALPDGTNSRVCPTNRAYCALPDNGATEGSPRAQAITQFMRKKQCEFMRRFPERCTHPD